MKPKIFKTLDEQIEILRSKGLIINDVDKTREILFRENYFFLSGYRHLLMEPGQKDKYITGATFEELYAIFVFDRMIRNTFFKNILVVENNVKSILSYTLSKKYGFHEKDYLNPKNYRQESFRISQINDVLYKMKRQIRLNGKQHTATLHYQKNYGYIPMWVSVKVLSFGIISELYTILKNEDQEEIASYYNIDKGELAIFLALLSNYRNLCAHEDILYDHRTQRSILDNEIHQQMHIEKIEDEYKYGKNDLFAMMIILKFMLKPGEFRDFMNEISYEIDRLDAIIDSVGLNKILNRVGLPDNWRELSNI